MVQGKIYCPEQISVPENYPNILKTYAKAVIRTQPYDLLRWSAAYFRCLASNVPPPVKLRLEKESKCGKLTRGYLRVLLEQIGKGYYVKRETLQHRWASLSLPENELLKFLSLCRMLHWSQIHWLELFAVMVGSLNDNFHSTVQMVCELLTDDPEGGPNSVPIWMFSVCYSFIAKLDCSETQTFRNGRKVLGKNTIEDVNKEPDPPKIYSLDLFRYALIERFIQKEHQKLHQETNEKDMSEMSSHKSIDTNYSDVSTSFNFVGLSDPEGVIRRTKDFRSIIVLLNEGQREALRNFHNEDTRNKVIQHLLIEKTSMKQFESEKDNASISLPGSFCSTVRSDISSSFKFIGDFKNPYEVIKKSPNIDDVLLILSKQQRNTLRNFTERQTTDQRVKEELFRDISRTDETSQYATDKSEITDRSNFTDLSKGLDPPWSWIYQFASMKQTDQSYNFVECDSIPTNETPTISTDGSFDFGREQFRVDGMTDQETISEEEQKENPQMLVGVTIEEIIDKVDQAVSSGKCDIENVKSMCSVIESDENTNITDENTKIVIEKLRKADENLTQFKNLQELSTYLKNEIEIPHERDVSCVDTLNETFKDFNIEVDENLMSKEIPTDMVLGLVNSKSEEQDEKLSFVEGAINGVIDKISTDPLNPPAFEERNENVPVVESFTSDTINDSDTNVKVPLNSPTYNYINDGTDISFECDIPPLPGIGKECSQKVLDSFLAFILSRAREEKGMVYTRFFKEMKCPVMTDNFD